MIIFGVVGEVTVVKEDSRSVVLHQETQVEVDQMWL